MWAPARRAAASALAFAALLIGGAGEGRAISGSDITLPPAQGTTLAGQAFALPGSLHAPANVFVIGFGRHTTNAAIGWEHAIVTQLARPNVIEMYNVAMLAEVPGFARSFVLGRMRKAVPEAYRANFIPVVDREDDWKHAAGYDPNQPEAAYVLVVDNHGLVRWSSHESYNAASWQALVSAAQQLTGRPGR